eukprot:scaffold125724_cov14-Prasinocladus_malaysianus.AAC.1
MARPLAERGLQLLVRIGAANQTMIKRNDIPVQNSDTSIQCGVHWPTITDAELESTMLFEPEGTRCVCLNLRMPMPAFTSWSAALVYFYLVGDFNCECGNT